MKFQDCNGPDVITTRYARPAEPTKTRQTPSRYRSAPTPIDSTTPSATTVVANPVTTVEMAQERSGIVVGLNKGHKTTPFQSPKNRISRTKGQSSRRTAFVREIAREVVGLAPYERRIIELLRNTQDKRARKLAKKRLGTFTRGKKKVEDMQRVIAESRRVAGGAH
ncbi:60S ribosomal eL36 domain-containing protein [Aspergillus tanneri]|uniref:60S ribosomal protein L36 n=2 Tax=Aspergillus tanneri TaxID=1220188 RepID=A0A5M9MQD9_9EURO|nr:60S ribosomal protein L36 [Aspergillus tanneri]KAA8649098.1 60S ribosomal protein L36 [Aspergillus tanneri]